MSQQSVSNQGHPEQMKRVLTIQGRSSNLQRKIKTTFYVISNIYVAVDRKGPINSTQERGLEPAEQFDSVGCRHNRKFLGSSTCQGGSQNLPPPPHCTGAQQNDKRKTSAVGYMMPTPNLTQEDKKSKPVLFCLVPWSNERPDIASLLLRLINNTDPCILGPVISL